MEEADKDWMMIRMVGGWVFLLVPAHPGSPGQRAVKRLLLLLFPLLSIFVFHLFWQITIITVPCVFVYQLLQRGVSLVWRWALCWQWAGVRRPGQDVVWWHGREEVPREWRRGSVWPTTTSLHHAPSQGHSLAYLFIVTGSVDLVR